MKRIAIWLCICCILFSLGGCAIGDGIQCYSYTYLDAFDTVTQLKLYTQSQETADAWAKQLHEKMVYLHNLYTIYSPFEQAVNLQAINQSKGEAVPLSDDVFNLLAFGKEAYTLTDGKVNMALGSVLKLWHTARTKALENPQEAVLPAQSVLQKADQHTDIQSVVLDEASKTVRLRDSLTSLDVGAFAKGYAVQQMAEYAKELGITSALISVGGNVSAVGDKVGTPFKIGIEDPKDVQTNQFIVNVKDCALVTSGNYQRYFMLDGERYHHLIDPDTLYPSKLWASVSVLGPDSGMADVLSTALFLLPQEQGAALLETVEGYEAVWVDEQGNSFYSDGFQEYLE